MEGIRDIEKMKADAIKDAGKKSPKVPQTEEEYMQQERMMKLEGIGGI
jgi:hypothetical protein